MRLRPLSWMRAKPALPVGGEPLIARILRQLASNGVCEAILNLHHLPETITRAVGAGAQFRVQVRYSWEDPVLGSGGGPRRAFSLTSSDELLIVNGDTFTDVDLASLVAAHRGSNALATMAVIDHPHAHRHGGIAMTSDGWYTGTLRRGEGMHFVGVQVVRREAFAALTDGEPAATIGGVYDTLARARPGSIQGFRTQASFVDIGTPDTYVEACVALGGDVTRGARCQVAASAQLSRCALWDDVVIEDDVSLTDCVVCDRVTLPRGSRYHRAVLLRPGDAPLGPHDRIEQHLHVAPFPTSGA
jgi:NDP-sugar pyrophosphorylase family protein